MDILVNLTTYIIIIICQAVIRTPDLLLSSSDFQTKQMWQTIILEPMLLTYGENIIIHIDTILSHFHINEFRVNLIFSIDVLYKKML